MSEQTRNTWGLITHTPLVILAFDGVLTVTQGLLKALFGVGFLATPSALTSLAAIVVVFWTTVASIFTPRVPMRVLIVPALFTAWAALGAMPLSIWWFLSAKLSLSMGFLQIVAVGIGFAAIRTVGTDKRPYYTVNRWKNRPAFSAPRTLGLLAALLLGGPLLTTTYVLGGLAYTVDYGTDGYMSFNGQGMVSSERVFTRDSSTVHLVGMVHVGEAQSYERLYSDFGSYDGSTLVLTEGVKDRESVLQGGGGYSKAAKSAKLSQQPAVEGAFETRNADIDVSDLPPDTVELIGTIMAVWGSDDRVVAFQEYMEKLESMGNNEEVLVQFFTDIVMVRNDRLYEVFEEEQASYDHLVMPWGALHLADIEQRLLEDGYVQTSETTHVIISYSAMANALTP